MIPFYWCGHWGVEGLSKLRRSIQLISREARIWTPGPWIQNEHALWQGDPASVTLQRAVVKMTWIILLLDEFLISVWMLWLDSHTKNTISCNILLEKLMERDMPQKPCYHFFLFICLRFQHKRCILDSTYGEIPCLKLFNHQSSQRKAVFTDGSCLQSALNFLCQMEEMIFFGKATFDADGWANYSAGPEPSPAKWGRLESIWFVGKTAIAQTSWPSLMFCAKLMSSEVSGMSQGCGIRGYILRVSFKTNSTFISLTTGSRTNGWRNTCHHSRVLDLNPRASTAHQFVLMRTIYIFFYPKSLSSNDELLRIQLAHHSWLQLDCSAPTCLFILHLPLSQLAATSIDTIICNIESHSVQLTSPRSAHSHANAAVSQLILWVRYHSLLCPARPTSLPFSSGCLYLLFILSCRCSEEKGQDGRCCGTAGLLIKVCYLFSTYVKQVSPGPFGIWPMAHRGSNEMDWG